MTAPASSPPTQLEARGLAGAMAAFLVWGLLPLYLRLLSSVPVLQIAAYRLIWGCLVAWVWLAVRGELSQVRVALMNPTTRWRLCLSATLISINWITYTWGIANGHVVETSLGYFINPLVNVVLGVLVLSERLNPTQWTAVALATAGVSYLTWSAGHPPWIALTLAASFGLYGLVRKLMRVEALAGFASETVLVVPLGIAFLIWCEFTGTGVASHVGLNMHLLLAAGGPLTAVPLVLFAFGARRIPYSTLGLLQYIAPTMQIILAVLVFKEPFTGPRVLGFTFIWVALAIYALDGFWRNRKAVAIAAA